MKKLLPLLFVLLLLVSGSWSISRPFVLTLTQANFLLRKDDGSESAATNYASANSNATITAGSTVRARFQITPAGTTASTGALIVQYNRNSAGWVTATTSSQYIKVVSSGFVTDGTATTQKIAGSSNFIAGSVDTVDGSTAAVTLDTTNPDMTEMEYCVQIVTADVLNTDSIQLRCAKTGGTALGTYTNTPTITVSKITSTHRRSTTGVGVK